MRTDALPDVTEGSLSRRAALAAGGLTTASAALLAAGCSARTPTAGDSTAPVAGTRTDGAGSPVALTAQGTGAPLGPASSVPVGGGRVFPAQKVVVTQPVAGQFRAFSAVCPHRGCMVNKVSNATINCPCHDSEFNIADGSVASGPAKQPLPARPVSAEGGVLRLG